LKNVEDLTAQELIEELTDIAGWFIATQPLDKRTPEILIEAALRAQYFNADTHQPVRDGGRSFH